MNIVLLLIGEDKDILKQVQNQLVKNDWLSIRSWSTDNPEGRIVSPAWFEQNASALAEYEEVDGCYNGTSLFDYTTDGECKRVIMLTLTRAENFKKPWPKRTSPILLSIYPIHWEVFGKNF